MAGGAEFAFFPAAGPFAVALGAADAAMEPVVSHPVANGEESTRWEGMTGPIASEIERLLTAEFAPTHLAVINDSAKHRGHTGDDGTGESHFTVEIESAKFAGVSRVQRQRMINAALGDIPGQRVHALALKARAPGE